MSKPKRKTKWDTHVQPNLNRIPKWRRDGLTEKQVAQKLGVAYSTLRVYRDQYSALAAALEKGKEELIEELEDSLYKRAKGYEYEEVKTHISKDRDGNQKTRIEKTTKHMPPDTGALAFALKNLAPEKWKDRRQIEHEGELEVKKDDKTKAIEEQIKTDKESRELLKEFFRRTNATSTN